MTPTPAPITDSDGSASSSGSGDTPDQGFQQAPNSELAAAVDLARAAADEEAAPSGDPFDSAVLTLASESLTDNDSPVGEHVEVQAEGAHAATHYFESRYPGYVGWRWAVTVAHAGEGEPVTVSEVVLLPGPDALVAPEWVPWSERVRPGDLGVGDVLPGRTEDPRLVPRHVASGDDELEALAGELPDVSYPRARVLSQQGRAEVAQRWLTGEFGPSSEMAAVAPGHCQTCGFFLPLTGAMGGGFGVCGNEVSPADGRAVHVEFGCGAHSETSASAGSSVPVADVVYDDTTLDFEPR